MFIDLQEMYKGIAEKAAESEYSTMVPQTAAQQKWEYAKGPGWLKLNTGNAIHHFTFPDTESPDFKVTKKHEEHSPDWANGAASKGRAQVHKSDPGLIYVTLMNGRENPTYTIAHNYENDWKVIPKPKKKKPNFSEIPKMAEEQSGRIPPSIGGKTFDFLMTPGAINPWYLRFLSGAGLGAGYHYLRQKLYNSPSENEAENSSNKTWLLRTMLPALGLTAAGALQNSVFVDNPRLPNYYDIRKTIENPTPPPPQKLPQPTPKGSGSFY